MRIGFDGEAFKGTHITGPTHNYLCLVVDLSYASAQWPLIEINSHPNEPRRLEADEVRGWINEGLHRANAQLGTDYGVGRGEFVISDSHYPEIYKALAERIVLTAHVWPRSDEMQSLFSEIKAHLQTLFGHSHERAEALLAEYNSQRGLWQRKQGYDYHNDDLLVHEGSESMAYIIEWMINKKADLGAVEFVNWRKADYERRRIR